MLSELGSTSTLLVYPLLVLSLTGSATAAGLVASARLLVQFVLRLPAGVLADRWDRRRLLLVCEAVRVLAFAGLTVAILTGGGSIALIVAVAVVESIATVFFDSAQNAVMRHLVPREQLGEALALNEARTYGAELAGPPLGGALFGLARAAPFLADALSFAVSFVAIASIKSRFQDARTTAHEPMRAAMALGWRFVTNEPFLRAVVTIAPLLNAALTGLILGVVIELESRGTSAATIGLVQAAVGLGGLVGALLTPRLQRRFRAPTLIVGAFWAAAVAAIVVVLTASGPLVALPLGLVLFLAPPANATLIAYQVAITPDELQGRVSSVIMLLATALTPFAPVCAGYLADQASGQVGLAAFAGVLVVAAVLTTLSRGIRHMTPLKELRHP